MDHFYSAYLLFIIKNMIYTFIFGCGIYLFLCQKRLNIMHHCSNVFGAVVIFLLKGSNNFIQQGHIKEIKSDSKDIYNVTKDFYFK